MLRAQHESSEQREQPVLCQGSEVGVKLTCTWSRDGRCSWSAGRGRWHKLRPQR